jgi:uncharacterized protein YqjF (DUF2071 family)
VSDIGEAGSGIALQRWRALLFTHWEVPLARLRSLIPAPLDIDTFEGKAYVGLIPFEIPELRPLRLLPPVPGAARFLETNVRTYVTRAGQPGVWFFSLDAASSLAVLGARAGYGLPYCRATMSCQRNGDEFTYRSERRWPGPPAALDVQYRVGQPLGPARVGTLEHFLVERYVLYFKHPLLGLMQQRVHHQPYPLRAVRVDRLVESLVSAAGISRGGERPPDLFSEGVDVGLSLPTRV